jgi:hypothetical protein
MEIEKELQLTTVLSSGTAELVMQIKAGTAKQCKLTQQATVVCCFPANATSTG